MTGPALHRSAQRRSAEAGFTLIETLVALAILAMSAVALLSATQAHIARIGDLEQRAAAQWVAENQLAELTLGLPATPAPPAMLGMGFGVTLTQTATAEPDLARVDIRVSGLTDARQFGLLTGFIDTGKPAQASGNGG